MDNENNKENNTIICPNCGSTMLKTSRCCIKCGSLNQNNVENKDVNPLYLKGEKIRKKEAQKIEEQSRKNLSPNRFMTTSTVSKESESSESKAYKIQSMIKKIIIVGVVIALAVNYKSIFGMINDYRKDQYMKQVIKIVNQTVSAYNTDKCHSTQVNEPDKKIIAFNDSSDLYETSLSLFTFDYFKGYIEIEDDGLGHISYKITISDGKYGFKDLTFDNDLNGSVVEKFTLDEIPASTYICE